MTEPTEKHLRIPYIVAAKYARTGSDAYEELVSIGNVALVTACRSHDSQKEASLATWISLHVEREIAQQDSHNPSNRYRQSGRWGRLNSLDALEDSGFSPSVSAQQSELETADAVNAVLRRLSPLNRAIYRLRHAEGLTYEEIGERVGKSENAIMYRLRDIQAHLDRSMPRRSNRGGVGNMRPIPGIKSRDHQRKLRAGARRHRKEVAIENRVLGKIPAHPDNWYTASDTNRELRGPWLSLAALLGSLNLTLSVEQQRNTRRITSTIAGLLEPLSLRLVRGPEARQLAESGYIARGPK